ncbi:MAG: hypothetical protein EZS28_003561 [Streblomastix strix]|uniref:Uncharacterized protein n=1 Tax=Streblomastix strix TaxID=222440 RepID=A0A5J4X0L9_9EUKA|nr:MAG: hypothetical protein EZS28_003561 [Streblomastix strix]
MAMVHKLQLLKFYVAKNPKVQGLMISVSGQAQIHFQQLHYQNGLPAYPQFFLLKERTLQLAVIINDQEYRIL